MNDDVFHFRDFSMSQAPSGQRVNTDSCVFGAVIGSAELTATPPKKMIDIGTGTGVLALMLALRFPESTITGIEPEASIAEVARKNFEASLWKDRLDVLCLRAQDLDPGRHGLFDFVLCNPPYFQNSMLSNDRLRAVARHNSDLSPEELYLAMTRVMTPDGSAWLSFPEDSTGLWMERGLQSGLHPTHQIIVKDHPEAKPHMSIVGWSRTKPAGIATETIHYRAAPRGDMSPWMRDFRRQWYPARYND
jgi:tRNA1Val (adenine37-N6)-methyltransferase